MRKTRWFVIPLLALSLIAAACGDDGDDTTTPGDTTTTPSGGENGGGGNGGDDCSLDGPVKIVGLAEKPPEGPNAIPDFAEGWEMAVEEVGDEVCGQPFEFVRIPASPTDASAAVNSYLQALDEEPTVIMGLASSTAVLAASPEIKKGGIPTIFSSATPQAFSDGEAGSEWGFTGRPDTSGIAEEAVKYFVEEEGAERIGLLCVNIAFGTGSCDAAEAAADALGAEVVARETNEATDTDLTSKITALKNANVDVVLSFNFPNPLVVLYKQAVTNGLDVPIYGHSSAGLIMGALNDSERVNAWGSDDCVPVTNPDQADWVAKYEQKFNKKMIGSGYAIAESYDMILFSIEAIKQAGSTDPEAVAEAMRELTYEGVCTTYKSDAGQGLHHATDLVQFDSDGVATSKKLVEIEPH